LINDVVSTTSNTVLNGKLYSKLLLALDGQALKNIVSRKHLHANGLLLLRKLIQTYKPCNVPEVIAFKTSEFWGNTKRFPSETIDDYYNQFHELLDNLEDAAEPISPKSAIRQFIFTLGSEFETLQNNFRLDNLPSKWNVQDWPSILVLCRDYYNSIKPQGLMKPDLFSQPQFDREAHQKKVKMWFMDPVKYHKAIESEQNKFPGKCLFHLPKSHPTEKCHVKLECDKCLGNKKKPSVPQLITTPVGQLRHMTEEIFEDTVEDDVTVAEPEIGSDTNEASLLYFALLSKHYLRLAQTQPNSTVPQRHSMPFPVIADSGANCHMFKERSFCDTLHPASGTVLLGDGITTLNIKGVGTVNCKVGSSTITILNVRYIPD